MVSKQWHFSQIEKANNNFLIRSRQMRIGLLEYISER